MNLLDLLRVDRITHECRHPDGCPVVVGPDALMCEPHKLAEVGDLDTVDLIRLVPAGHTPKD